MSVQKLASRDTNTQEVIVINSSGQEAGSAATVKGYQQITSLSTATALTAPSGSTYALIQSEGGPVRWRDDGTSPTASVGELLTVGSELWYDANLAAVKFIELVTGTKLNIHYYA